MRVFKFYKCLKYCIFGGLICISLTGCNKELPQKEAAIPDIVESVSNNTPEKRTENNSKGNGVILTKRRIPSEKRIKDQTNNNVLSAADQDNFEKIIDNLIAETCETNS